MNKTERVETLEDSVGTVRIGQWMGEKIVSDSLKIGIAMMVTACKGNCLPFTKN